MSTTVNPRTGLREEQHHHYNVPLVYQKNTGAMRFGGQATAVHTAPMGNGLTLDFYAKFGGSEELFVLFHGASSPERNFYPRFERIQTFRNKAKAFIAFADPTIQVDKDREMLLSWYLGGPGWDPNTTIMKAVNKAKAKSGAKHIAFVGGSGGGFAALRISALVPGSMAFVQEPQTNIASYIPSVVETYFSKVWPGWDSASLLNAFPERFDMIRHYRESQPKNFVYYTQSIDDLSHVQNHYEPFKLAHGVVDSRGWNTTKNRYFALYDGEIKGHGRMTSDEFSYHYERALVGWRENRSHQSSL